jgi:hypothetical protein
VKRDDVTNDSARASDADRTAVAEQLRHASDDGRLNVTEYGDRARSARAATTQQELAALTSDLSRAGSVHDVVKQRGDPTGWDRRWSMWLAGNLFFVALWGWASIATGALVFFWPGFFLLITAAAIGVDHFRRRSGSSRSGC